MKYVLILLTAILWPIELLAGSPPNDVDLGSSLSDIHLEILGGLESLRNLFGNSASLHGMLVTEPRNLVWAESMERQIRASIQSGAYTFELNLLAVECRESICELQAISKNPDTLRDWERKIEEIRRQSWNDFGQTSGTYGIVDNQFVMITHLLRKESKFRHCFVNIDKGACPDPANQAE